ncbi:PTS system mannose/fructose/sorbose family transporter subunit IID [bacterium]|nr:PTS system mannose/fructose/sorbose family transporter subunit IID [bacterium]
MNDNSQKIRTIDLFFASLRSFFLEVFWNFERMQNLGCVYVLSPVIKKLYPVESQRKEILRQHLEFFNTHPYMAAPLLGIIISLEEEAALKKDRCPEFISQIKSCMAGPFAALGDSFFWATWRPFTSAIGICLFFLNREKTFIYWAAPGLFLVFYNIVHLIVQNVGLWVGYFLKTRLIEVVSRIDCLRIIRLLRLIGLCFLGITLFVFLNNDLIVWNKKILFFSSFMVFSFFGYREWSQTKLFYGLIFGSILISYFNLI